jgi:hypothetical protein
MYFRCFAIASLLYLLTGCTKANHLDDTILPVIEQWDTMQYRYDDNSVPLTSRNLDEFLARKRVAIARLATDTSSQNEVFRAMENIFTEGFDFRKENTGLYYEGVISGGNKSFNMNIAQVNIFKLTLIALSNNNF